jgi:hypothetical protein
MTDDKIENLNEHRLRKEVDNLETDKDIIKFARWVNDHVTDDFMVTSDYGMSYNLEVHTKKETKDHIRDILMAMPDKNGYYTPPYK